MTNAIIVAETFEEKMKARIRESIGELISDAELAKLVETGIEQAFFAGQQKKDNYGRIITTEPLIYSIVKECLQAPVNELVIAWFVDNNDVIETLIDQAIRDGISTIVLRTFDQKLQSSLISFGQILQTNLKNMT